MRNLLAAACAATLLTSAAPAAELIFDYSKSVSSSSYTYGPGSFYIQTAANIPVFDQSLGQLNFITIAYDAEDKQTYSGVPDPNAPVDTYPGYPSYWAGGIRSQYAFYVSRGTDGVQVTQDGGEGYVDEDAISPVTSTPLEHDLTFSDSVTYTDHQLLHDLQNGGQVAAYLGHVNFDVAVGINDVHFEEAASDHLRLTYDYTPNAVPEPVTWAMLIGGVGVTGAATRRGNRERRASAKRGAA